MHVSEDHCNKNIAEKAKHYLYHKSLYFEWCCFYWRYTYPAGQGVDCCHQKLSLFQVVWKAEELAEELCVTSGREATQENVFTFFIPVCLKGWSLIYSESYQKNTLLKNPWPVSMNLQSMLDVSVRLSEVNVEGHQVNSLNTSRSTTVIKKHVLGASNRIELE